MSAADTARGVAGVYRAGTAGGRGRVTVAGGELTVGGAAALSCARGAAQGAARAHGGRVGEGAS